MKLYCPRCGQRKRWWQEAGKKAKQSEIGHLTDAEKRVFWRAVHLICPATRVERRIRREQSREYARRCRERLREERQEMKEARRKYSTPPEGLDSDQERGA